MHSNVTQQRTSSTNQTRESDLTNNFGSHPLEAQDESTNFEHRVQVDTRESVLRRIFRTVLSTVMNAAVTIFGVGVGVGIILGDAYPVRSASSVNSIRTMGQSNSHERYESSDDVSSEELRNNDSVGRTRNRGETQESRLPAQ